MRIKLDAVNLITSKLENCLKRACHARPFLSFGRSFLDSRTECALKVSEIPPTEKIDEVALRLTEFLDLKWCSGTTAKKEAGSFQLSIGIQERSGIYISILEIGMNDSPIRLLSSFHFVDLSSERKFRGYHNFKSYVESIGGRVWVGPSCDDEPEREELVCQLLIPLTQTTA